MSPAAKNSEIVFISIYIPLVILCMQSDQLYLTLEITVMISCLVHAIRTNDHFTDSPSGIS